jgi:hypothetical protein
MGNSNSSRKNNPVFSPIPRPEDLDKLKNVAHTTNIEYTKRKGEYKKRLIGELYLVNREIDLLNLGINRYAVIDKELALACKEEMLLRKKEILMMIRATGDICNKCECANPGQAV